jgi:hypothetical protein
VILWLLGAFAVLLACSAGLLLLMALVFGTFEKIDRWWRA